MNPQDELRKLFRGVVEQVFFTEIGICAPALTAHLSGMLADFVHIDQIYRMRGVDGSVIQDVSRLHAKADLGSCVDQVSRERIISRYVGDFSLFWVGLYPETLRPRRQCGIDRLGEYILQGRRGYEVAGRLSQAEDVPSANLLLDLSEQFEFCVHGLHLVRRSWEQMTRGPRQN